VACRIDVSLLGSAQEFLLLVDGLEASMAVLGGSIDELEVEWLVVRAACRRDERLAEGDGALAGTSNAAFDHDPVLVDLAVVRKSTNRGDALLGEISLSGSRFGITLLSNAEDPLVDLSTVMVSLLTSTSNGGGDTGRMPRSNASNLAKSTMSLARKTSDAPTANNAGVT